MRNRRLPPPAAGTSPQAVDGWQDDGLRRGLDTWMRAVMRLDALDPTATELIRLRCAANHDCRFCLSLRLELGGDRAVDEATTGRIRHDDVDDLSERHRALLQLVDAMTSQPREIDDDLIEQLRRHVTDVELSEATLDVMKFSHQKIKVALGVDVPARDDGVPAPFTIDEDGRPLLGGRGA